MKNKVFQLNKVLLVLLLVFMSFALVACGSIEEDPGDINTPIEPGDSTEPIDPSQKEPIDIDNPIETTVEFCVSLVYNKKIFIPTEKITVYWADDYSQYSQEIDSEGYAKIKLDGDFNVYLSGTPSGYTYNPNIYTADNENPVIEIELLRVGKISKGKGTALYKEYEIISAGTYRSEIKQKNKQVFYEFQPKTSGYYVIESLVNVYEDTVNPKIDVYSGTTSFKNYSETIDSGGKSLKGGYTKNFKWTVQLTDAMLSNVYTFAVYCDSKDGIYPVYIDFTITYMGEYIVNPTATKLMHAEEANFITAEGKGTYRNADGGTGSYYEHRTNGTGILDGSNFKYNEATGYYHVYDSSTDTYGPILCAAITSPCAFYDESLDKIESHGNKDLTVSSGTENYKQFIEISYAATCNSDGVCYVTKELKEFLQKFSISQGLFSDGNGFCEDPSKVYATEDNQWLFACGYYDENA